MRKQRLKPDTRLDWRDPDMPLVRTPVVGNVIGYIEITSDRAQKACQALLAMNNRPGWSNDPTYDLRRRRPV